MIQIIYWQAKLFLELLHQDFMVADAVDRRLLSELSLLFVSVSKNGSVTDMAFLDECEVSLVPWLLRLHWM
jgi:hypothetical protein